MKNISILACVLLFCLGIASCDKEDYTGYSTVTPTSPNATISIDYPSYLVESDSIITYTITLDEPQVADIVYNVVLDPSSTATEGEDFDYEDQVIMGAYSTEATGTISLYRDLDFEPDETIKLTIGAGASSTPNNTYTPQEVEITLDDYPFLATAYVWEDSVVINDTARYFCEYVDLDFLVFSEAGEDQGIYQAATGSCPEFLDLQNLADGVYYIKANLWSNSLPDSPEVVSFPITMYYGAGYGNIHGQVANIITSEDPDSYDDGAGILADIAKITLTDGIFEVEGL